MADQLIAKSKAVHDKIASVPIEKVLSNLNIDLSSTQIHWQDSDIRIDSNVIASTNSQFISLTESTTGMSHGLSRTCFLDVSSMIRTFKTSIRS